MAPATGKTLFDKIWDQHVVADLGDGFSLCMSIAIYFTTEGGRVWSCSASVA